MSEELFNEIWGYNFGTYLCVPTFKSYHLVSNQASTIVDEIHISCCFIISNVAKRFIGYLQINS